MSAQKFKFVLNLKQLMCFLALNFAFLDKSIWRQEKLSDNFPTVQNLGGGVRQLRHDTTGRRYIYNALFATSAEHKR